MFEIITEESARIKISKEKKISKKLSVFYNPVMKFNRDISVLLLGSLDKENMRIALPLAGTGIRGIRFFKELDKNKIKKIYFNDLNKKAAALIKNNLRINNIKNNKIIISNKDANEFLIQSKGFDYIDVDPFGSPNPFLDSSIVRLTRNGILAVTATDTSSLAGSHPKACLRKYWAKPLRNELMHEIGIRILIRKIQLVAAQYEKALKPLFSYFKDHYYRIFFLCEKRKKRCDEILKKHEYFEYENEKYGPLWTGNLWDNKLVNKIYKNNKNEKNEYFLKTIKEESKINTIAFLDLHKISKKYKIAQMAKKETVIEKLRKKGFKVSNTHFTRTGIRTDAKTRDVVSVLR